MDLDQLRAFYLTAKLESFTEAARRMYLTQPAISLKIKALEKHVGDRLIERKGRRISPTPIGVQLLPLVSQLLEKYGEIEQLARDVRGLGRGRLSIGASDTASIYVLPDLLEAFRSTHPGIELSIESRYSDAVVGRVLDRELELGIVSLPQSDARLKTEALFPLRFVALVPSSNALAARAKVSAHDIAMEALVMLGPGSTTRGVIEEYLGRSRRPLEVAVELSSFEIIKRYVRAGLGVSLVPEMVLEPRDDGVAAIVLEEDLVVQYGAVYRKDAPLSLAASSFLDLARERLSGR
jgi:DNA-binding transcriptional LysR family regulator